MTSHFESRFVSTVKAILLAVAMAIVLWTQTSFIAQVAAVVCTLMGAVVGRIMAAKSLRLSIGITVIWLGFFFAFLVPEWIRDSTNALAFLDARETLIFSDCAGFGLLGFTMAFGLRYLSCRWRAWAVFEASVVVGSVIWLFRQHQNERIDRPRFLTDWALMQGYDPTSIVMIIGAVVGAVAMAMVLYNQRHRTLALSVLVLAILAYLYSWHQPEEKDPDIPPPTSGLLGGEPTDASGNPTDGRPRGGSSGGGASDPMMRNDASSGPNEPVAVAIFHADYRPANDILYFRQQVLSHFDGKRLSIDTVHSFDDDVIRDFPFRSSVQAGASLAEDFHIPVPTSMFLMRDHPQPMALTSSVEITPTDNPAPHKFVTAYDVVSWVPSTPIHDMRFLGRRSVPSAWSEEKTAHYLEYPDDPRYESLSHEIIRDIDPRYADDTLVKALKIKTYLEKEGFYTRKERHANVEDPAASFLFGSLRGYCVHFAHAAAHLFRSQGIASRVAVGYAVNGRLRGNGSAVLIMADRAHAWPEIHIDGVGWIPFDIYPERSDEPPGEIVPQDLESLLGEMARGDLSGGRADEAIDTPFEMPWARIQTFVGLLILGVMGMAYLVKIWRLMRVYIGRQRDILAYVAIQDILNDRGLGRWIGETRNRHAQRIQAVAPSMIQLTETHLHRQVGGHMSDGTDIPELCSTVRRELRHNLPPWKTFLGMINPIGWWYTK